MDFQSLNPFNVRLNLISGNLLPMTENSSFPLFWKIYSIFVWLFEFFNVIALIAGLFFVSALSAEKISNGLYLLNIIVEANLVIIRIHTQTVLIQQLIRKLNDILNTDGKNMRNIIIINLKSLETPFKFYLVIGTFSVIFWCSVSLPLIFERNIFYYTDFQEPVIYFAQEPFSANIFLLGSIAIMINNTIVFIKKASTEIYMTHVIALLSSQYQYIASRFVLAFRNCNKQNNSSFLKSDSKIDMSIEKEIKNLCRQYNNILYITLTLKKVLSINILLTYLSYVFQFCFIGVMFSKISVSFFEGFMVLLYGFGSILQFYILCNCFQKLSDTTTEITDKAFHEEWYRFNLPVKRLFLMMITASNNLDLRISLIERFNLSLPAFMAILNQSYSIALLLLRMN